MIRTLLKRVSLPQTRTITTLKSILNQTSNTASKADDAAAVNAFSQRTGLIFSNQHVLIDALTHKSITEKSTQYHILEYVMTKYPQLPSDAVESIAKAYWSIGSLHKIGMTWGLKFVLRSKSRVGPDGNDTPTVTGVIQAWIVQSLIGAYYKENGAKKTREFVVNQILSRSVDIQQHIDMFVKMKQPRMLLNNIASKLSQPKPVSRLLKESGRASVAPVFIVGMYVDSQKIGEGYGSSIAMAETRAIKDALIKYYTDAIHQEPLDSYNNVEGDLDLTFFESLP